MYILEFLQDCFCLSFKRNNCQYADIFLCKSVPHTNNQCKFEYPSWANLSGPSLGCTAYLQLLKPTCVSATFRLLYSCLEWL